MISLPRILGTEIRQEVWRTRAYWVEFLGAQALFILGFLLLSGLFQILAEGQYNSRARLISLIGFITWQVADGCLVRTADSFSEDAQWGTLEQVWLSAVSPGFIILARSAAILLAYMVRAGLVAIVLLLVLRLSLHLSVAMLVVFLLTQVGVFGIAFMVVGFHLVYKSVASLTLVLSTALLFITGALVPLDNAPVLALVGKLLPLGLGVSLLRDLVLGEMALPALLAQPAFYWLLIHTALYALAGWRVLHWGQETARLHGSLAHY